MHRSRLGARARERRLGPFLRRRLRSRACGRRCAGKLRLPYENVRTRDQPDVLRLSRRRSGPAEPLGGLRAFRYGDSVSSSHEVNRSVALFDVVPLHLRSLLWIGAHYQARIANSYSRSIEKCTKLLMLLQETEQGKASMKPSEFQRWLRKRRCSFESHKGGSGHLTVRRGNRTSQLPMHGSRRELGTKLVAKIKRDLGL